MMASGASSGTNTAPRRSLRQKTSGTKRPLEDYKSSAKKRSINASSTMCGVVSLFDALNCLETSNDLSDLIDDWVDKITDRYNLCDLIRHHQKKVGSGGHEEACKGLVKQLLKQKNVRCAVDEEIDLPDFKKMHMAIYSNWHKPDVAIYLQKFKLLILIVEVHSCSKKYSFGNTIRKIILGLIDVLRYYTNYDPNLTILKGFVFPKLDVNKCVVEVTVKFSNLKFYYDLKQIAMDHVEESLNTVWGENIANIGNIKLSTIDRFEFYIKLSENEMGKFGGTVHKQVPSNEAIMFLCSDYYYKFPVTKDDYKTIKFYAMATKEKELQHFLKLEVMTGISGYRYPAIKYDHLSPKEAHRCLGDFVLKVYEALTELHANGFQHCDVRLENICFKEDYSVMFIDMDRSRDTDSLDSTSALPGSCMYCLKLLKQKIGVDFLQLGCIILWVLTGSNGDYHKQKLPADHSIVSNVFFLKLWQNGKL